MKLNVGTEIQQKHTRGKLGTVMNRIEPLVLVAAPLIMFAWAVLQLPNAAIVTSACAGLSIIPFFVSFESARHKARDLMPVIVMTALAVAGRLIFAPIPSVRPVTAIIIITGLCFGREEGFISGALTMLVSNIFFGQGPWTLWQMYGLGLVGYLAGAMGSRGLLKSRLAIAVFGFAMPFLYGFILDTWTFVGFVAGMSSSSMIATYTAGFFTNLAGAISTVVFLLPIAISWPKMFGRIKEKYEIGTA